MKIFAYRIAQKGPRALPTLVDHINRQELQDRFGIGGLRLEDRGVRGSFLVMDFAKPRGGHGPGRMSRNEALHEFRLRSGENFGEDTAVAYDPATGYAAIQYNHYGPRSRSIEEYLWSKDMDLGGARDPRPGETDADRFGFNFGALLKRDAYERLRRFEIVHDIAFTVAIPGITQADFDAGRSLGEILSAPLPDGVETLSMTITAAPRHGVLARDGAMGMIDDLRRLGGALQRAVVRGKRTIDDPFDSVDLVEERISEEADIELGVGQRYTRADRWSALATTLRQWLRNGTLTGVG